MLTRHSVVCHNTALLTLRKGLARSGVAGGQSHCRMALLVQHKSILWPSETPGKRLVSDWNWFQLDRGCVRRLCFVYCGSNMLGCGIGTFIEGAKTTTRAIPYTIIHDKSQVNTLYIIEAGFRISHHIQSVVCSNMADTTDCLNMPLFPPPLTPIHPFLQLAQHPHHH